MRGKRRPEFEVKQLKSAEAPSSPIDWVATVDIGSKSELLRIAERVPTRSR
jgi:hypothetical protein